MSDETKKNAQALLAAADEASPVILLPKHVKADLESLTLDGDAPVLELIRRLVARRQQPPAPLPRQFTLTSLRYWSDGGLRSGDHGGGLAADIGGMNFEADAPDDIVQILTEVLATGATRVGLPFQGVFFPPSARCADGDAFPAAGCLQLDRAHLFRSGGEDKNAARSMILSAEVRTLLAEHADVLVFPDRDNHLHVSIRPMV